MLTRVGVAVASAFLWAVLSTPAAAQTGAATIDERVGQVRPPTERALEADEAILTGREDLVLLRRADLFTLRAGSAYRYTTNAFLSDNDRKDDHILSPSASFGIGTRIDQRFDVFADISVFASRYEENTELDFDAFSGRIGGEMPAGPWRLGLTYSGTPVYTSGFEDHQVTLHDISLQARRSLALGEKTVLLPSVTATRVFGDPNDFSTVGGRVQALVAHKVSDEVTGFLGGNGYGRRYDDFFESRTDETRYDYGVSGQAIVSWRPAAWIDFTSIVSVTQNFSTVDENEYFSFDVSPSMNLTVRF